MSNPFIDSEAINDRSEEEEEEEEEGGAERLIEVEDDRYSDEDMTQDHLQLRLLEGMPHNPRFRDWMQTVSSISEKYEASTAPSEVSRSSTRQQVSSGTDSMRSEANHVPDSQLHHLLRLDETSSFWRLKCQAGEQYTLIHDIYSFFIPTAPIPSPEITTTSLDAAPFRWSQTLFPPDTCGETKVTTGSDSRSCAWCAVVNYVTSGQTIPQIHEELEGILKDKYDAANWDAAVAAATPEGDEYASAQAAVYELATADGYPMGPKPASSDTATTFLVTDPLEIAPASSSATVPPPPLRTPIPCYFAMESPIRGKGRALSVPPFDFSQKSRSSGSSVPPTTTTAPVDDKRASSAPPGDRTVCSSHFSDLARIDETEEAEEDNDVLGILKDLSTSHLSTVSAGEILVDAANVPTLLFLPSSSPSPAPVPLPSVEQMLSEVFAAPSSPLSVHSPSQPFSPPPPVHCSSASSLKTSPTSTSPICAAFCVPHVIDCIYLEGDADFHPDAAKMFAFATFLHQHSAVRRFKSGRLMLRISTGDAADLMRWDRFSPIRANSWV
ncbi:hypothetical protein VKT23_014538 [Stygiomarasmius scandens]|uniref:Uncharacterized protein n=1 Tax=Marasmiellus scandens TaxID=2682957 RepID=A0ABR1J0E2_9AGAR